MNRLLGAVFAGTLLAANLNASPAVAGERTLTRTEDPIVVTGDELASFQGMPIESLRLYAWRGGQWSPVPYQIDEKDPDGNFVISSQTIPESVIEEIGAEDLEPRSREQRIAAFERKRGDYEERVEEGKLTPEEFERLKRSAYFTEHPGEFDYNDELVFMAGDIGDAAPPSEWLTETGAAIGIRDPLSGGRAWAYLFHFPDPPPARSPVDYVSYDPKGDRVEMPVGTLGFIDEKPLIADEMIGKLPGGELMPNILDRFKLRITVRPIPLLCAPLHFDENNTRALTVGYRDGPVRVIRRNVFWVVIGGLKLPFAPNVTMYFQFYRNGLVASARFSAPLDAAYVLCPGSTFTTGLDLRRAAYGAKVFTADNPPIVVDGVMSEAEKNLTVGGQTWIAGYLSNGMSIVSQVELDPELIRRGAGLDLKVIDDAGEEDPPEAEPGRHLIGYAADARKIPAGKFDVAFRMYVDRDFDEGDEQRILQIATNPLEVSVGKDRTSMERVGGAEGGAPEQAAGTRMTPPENR